MRTLRIGRLLLRTRKRHVMVLPSGYREPLIAYLVEYENASGEHEGQFGAFTTEAAAQACIERLTAEGWSADNFFINVVPIHQRVEDWQWNR